MVYGKMDVAGNGRPSKNNCLICNVSGEQGSAGLGAAPMVCAGSPRGLSSLPLLSCSVWAWTNPLSSQMPRKHSSVRTHTQARAHTYTHTSLLGKSPHLALM